MWQFLFQRSSLSRLRIVSVLLIFSVPLAAQQQNASPRTPSVKVKRGLTISLSLLTPLDSAHAKVGDDVTARLSRPLIADGATILPRDWIVHGTVTKVKRAGKNCHDGSIRWKLGSVITPRGEQIEVQPVESYQFDPNHTGDPDWVPLDTPLKKVGRASAFVGLTASVVALSPLMIPLGIAAMEPCRGELGRDQALPAGTGLLVAVSKNIRVKRLP